MEDRLPVPEFKVVVRYQAQPGKAEQARRELQSLIEMVLPEAGCRGITLHESLSNPGELLLYEHWTDVETYLGPHSETPHLQEFIAKAGKFLAGPPEITLWRAIE